MIRTLRTRLVAAAMLSLLVVLVVILGAILLNSYQGIVSDADRILDLLAEGEGTFPTLPADFNWEEEGPRRRSPELGYEIRYFSGPSGRERQRGHHRLGADCRCGPGDGGGLCPTGAGPGA